MARVSSVTKIAHEIEAELKRDKDKRIHRETLSFAEKVRDQVVLEWEQSMQGVKAAETGTPHPYETGKYVESIKVERTTPRKGFLAWKVVSRDPKANWIEYGTGPDKPGSRSPWGPHTPTPEFAPFGKAAHHFGGTVD